MIVFCSEWIILGIIYANYAMRRYDIWTYCLCVELLLFPTIYDYCLGFFHGKNTGIASVFLKLRNSRRTSTGKSFIVSQGTPTTLKSAFPLKKKHKIYLNNPNERNLKIKKITDLTQI